MEHVWKVSKVICFAMNWSLHLVLTARTKPVRVDYIKMKLKICPFVLEVNINWLNRRQWVGIWRAPGQERRKIWRTKSSGGSLKGTNTLGWFTLWKIKISRMFYFKYIFQRNSFEIILKTNTYFLMKNVTSAFFMLKIDGIESALIRAMFTH